MSRPAGLGKALQVLATAGLCIALLPGVTAGRPRDAAPAGSAPARDVIVHLFQWPWQSVAAECTAQLGPAGVGAIQVSPPQEHVVLPGYPWWQDHQPVSYRLASRRGDRAGFARGDRGYVMINRSARPVTRTVDTGLPAGTYTDLLHGATVTVDAAGRATLTVPGLDALAIRR